MLLGAMAWALPPDATLWTKECFREVVVALEKQHLTAQASGVMKQSLEKETPCRSDGYRRL